MTAAKANHGQAGRAWLSRRGITSRGVRHCAIALLITCGGAIASAQPSRPPAARPAPPTVGASQIFSALTQPDRVVEVELLRGLRDSLARKPDAAVLEAVRAQLDTILQAEEMRQGDMPPALVMSALASRMEAAVAGLEAARQAQPPPRPLERPWLVPALAALAGLLATALAYCLTVLAGRAPPPQDAADMSETLGTIERRLEETAAGMHQALSLAETVRGEASDIIQQAAGTIGRLTSAAQEADTRLRGSIESAEQRLTAESAISVELRHWLESVPGRLAEAMDRAEASGARRLDSVAADIAAGFATLTESLPATALEWRKTIEALAQAGEAETRIRDEVKSAAQRLEERLTALTAGNARVANEADFVRFAHDVRDANRPILDFVTQLGARIDQMNASLPEAMAAVVAAGVARGGEAAAHVPQRLLEEVRALRLEGSEAIELACEKLTAIADDAGEKTAAFNAAQQALQNAAAALNQLAKDKAAVLEGASGVLNSQVSRLESSVGASQEAVARAGEAVEAARADATSAAARLSECLDAAVRLPVHVEALRVVTSRLQAEAATGTGHVALDLAGTPVTSVRGMNDAADRMLALLARMEAALGAEAVVRDRQAAEAPALQTSQAESTAARLEALFARADASVGAIGAETAALAASAAELRADAELLRAVALRMERGAADEAGECQMLESLLAAARRIEDNTMLQTIAADAMGETAAGISGDLQRAASSMSAGEASLSMAARVVATATEEAMATLMKLPGRAGAADAVADGIVADAQKFLTVQTARLAELLDRSEKFVGLLQAAASQEADAAGASTAALRTHAASEMSLHAADDERAHVLKVIAEVQALASNLASRAEAQEVALERVTQAASAVAALVAPGERLRMAGEAGWQSGGAMGVTQTQVTSLAKHAELLRHSTEKLASSALRGEVPSLSADLVSHTPTLLATIETCIHHLRGAGTALALASDACHKAA